MKERRTTPGDVVGAMITGLGSYAEVVHKIQKGHWDASGTLKRLKSTQDGRVRQRCHPSARLAGGASFHPFHIVSDSENQESHIYMMYVYISTTRENRDVRIDR